MSLSGTIRVGIAGMTSDHVWAMGDGLAALPGVELVAGAEAVPELLDLASRRWRLRHTYPDVGRMLENEELNAILVCSDNANKADIVELAARRGVHVYQDKPMAATLAQADRILRAVEESGITLMVAYHTAFNPVYHQVRRAIVDGVIGQVYLARGVTGHSGPLDFGCSPYFCDWLFDADRNGGGCFVDEACYLINAFLDYLGPIVEVSAFMTQMGVRDYLPPGVEDNAVAILRFASGALGVIDAKWGQIGPTPVRTSYHGTAGTIISAGGPAAPDTDLYTTCALDPQGAWVPLGDVEQRSITLPTGITPARGDGVKAATVHGWRAVQPDPSIVGSGGAEQRYFIDCLRNGQPVQGAPSPRLARDTQEVIEAVYLSAQHRQAVALPLPTD